MSECMGPYGVAGLEEPFGFMPAQRQHSLGDLGFRDGRVKDEPCNSDSLVLRRHFHNTGTNEENGLDTIVIENAPDKSSMAAETVVKSKKIGNLSVGTPCGLPGYKVLGLFLFYQTACSNKTLD